MSGPWEQYAPATEMKGPWDSFADTTGGAATGNPSIQAQGAKVAPTTRRSLDIPVIAGAGAAGAAIGVAAPEILRGAAGAAAAFPMTARIAPLLSNMSVAAQGAGRVAGGISGGVSGLAGESAGQTAEAMGAPQAAAETARFVGGSITPEFKAAIPLLFKAVTFGKGGAALDAGREIINRLAGREGKLTDEQKAYITQTVAELHGSQKPEEALRAVGQAMGAGSEAARKKGYQDAYKVLSDSERAAQLEVDRAMTGPVSDRDKAVAYLDNLKTNASDRAKAARLTIGEDREISDIGNELRSVAVARKDAARQSASDAFTAAQNDVKAIVAGKEANPDGLRRSYVNQTPAYRALVGNLQAELANGKHSPDVARGFEKILQSITNPERDIFGQPKPVSFQQIDDARRMLGEAFRGQPAEGYGAIGDIAAKEYYRKLRDVQEQFGGPKVGQMLRDYADSKAGLEVFGSKAGKKLTALDKYDDAQFATDAASLPRSYFSSPEQFKNLIELTGSKELATLAAKDYVTNQLKGLDTAKQVGDWMLRNRDFLNTVPEVHLPVADYLKVLEASERTAKNLDVGAKRLAGEQKNILSLANSSASAIRAGGQVQSKAAIAEAERLADSLFGGAGDVKRARDLIEGGDFKAWEAAAPVIERSPQAKLAVADAVRQTLSERPAKGITQYFSETVRPAMQKVGMLSAEDANQIAGKLAEIEAMKIPEKEKLGFVKRVISQGLSAYAGSGAARTARAMTQEIPKP